MSLAGRFHHAASRCQMGCQGLWQRLLRSSLFLSILEGIWGEGCSFSQQEQYAPFNLCGRDTPLELEQVMNF